LAWKAEIPRQPSVAYLPARDRYELVMPFKSKAQWNKFGQMLTEGKISRDEFDEWSEHSRPYSELPEKRKSKKKRRRKGGRGPVPQK